MQDILTQQAVELPGVAGVYRTSTARTFMRKLPWVLLAALLLGASATVLLGIRQAVAARAAADASFSGWSAQGRPSSPLPQVEAVEILALPADQARAINAQTPFVIGAITPAAPFRFTGDRNSLEAATACLAAAVLYEAGDDRTGQRAVAQVVLNRVRHPAFPKSVCGVVLQGSERSTGCQFTFTCDGALSRSWSAAAWDRARFLALGALSGSVDPSVGLATHYHTNWVVPAWSAKLDKIAQVGTHLFFKWKGDWGSSRVMMTQPRLNAETVGSKLAARLSGTSLAMALAPQDLADPDLSSPASVSGNPSDSVASAGSQIAIIPPAGVDLRGSTLILADNHAASYVIKVQPGQFSGDYASAALSLCRGRAKCVVLGYLPDQTAPVGFPITAERTRAAAFSFDAATGRAYWDCRRIARSRKSDCMSGTGLAENAEKAGLS